MHTSSLLVQPTSNVPPYVANGVVGLRPDWTMAGGTCTVNGYAGAHPQDGVESWLYAPYPLAFEIECDGTVLEGHLERSNYDFACGELQTEMVLGDRLCAQVLLFCSRSLPHVVAQEMRLQVQRDVTLILRARVDGASAQGTLLEHGDGTFDGRHVCDGWSLWRGLEGGSVMAPSLLGVALCVDFGQHERFKSPIEGGVAARVSLRAGEVLYLRQLAALVPSVAHPEPHREAVRIAYMAHERGFEKLREENRVAWRELWRGRPLLHGAGEKWQRFADAAFFYLHSSAHRSSPCSTGLFGVGQWPGYHCFRGHVFWDIETFAFPPLLLSQPEAARALLDYRWRHFDAAQRNARLQGYAGILFPWESGPLSGAEVTPSGWPHIIHEQHVALDVAFAFAQYAHARDDAEWTREQAWPVLREVARWLSSRLQVSQRGWELRHAMGICEDRPNDNPSFVLLLAGVVLREAAQMAQRFDLARDEREGWQHIAAHLALPQLQNGVLPRCDNFEPDGKDHAATETLAAFYPFTTRLDDATTRATLHFYLQQGRDALGMPMLPPLFAVHAARLGDRELALELWERGAGDYLIEPFEMIDEFGATHTRNKPKVGPYLAHAGAVVMNLMMGFPGLQLSPEVEQWPQFPVVLPQGWDAIEVERLWVQGRERRLLARHGDTRAQLLSP